MLRKALPVFCLILAIGINPLSGQERKDTLTLEFEQSQTAVLDPVEWDRVIPHERYFDAVRAMLVRFPGCAEAIHARLAEGCRLEKAELVLEWERQEGPRPERGRHGWGAEELYKNKPGEWHVVARPLLRPWSVDDPELGPTFNASIRGLAFWEEGGGRRDGRDRGRHSFGPAPLHPGAADAGPAPSLAARLDVTPVLADQGYGATVGERLRALEARGFQVHKLEIRDMKYRSFWAYDWCVGIGCMRIWVKAPRLVLTLRRDAGAARVGPLPPALGIAGLAAQLAARGGEGKPSTAFPADLPRKVARFLQRPEGIPDWQWRRIQDLRALGTDPTDVTLNLGRGYNFNTLLNGDEQARLASMRELLRMPPRTWHGHLTSDFAILATGFSDWLPPAVVDHLRLYWTAWLHPDVPDRNDIGGGEQRGGPSYFRGYSTGGGTMNFGHNAVMGALLAGQFLHSPHVLKDARQGVEHLSREWGLASGAHQEIGDTYYQALSLGAVGAIARFAQDPVDRLLGRFHRDRLLEPLMSMYHPGLRRMTHPMGRGSFAYHILLQEGPYHVLHTLSPAGALMHLDELTPERKGTPTQWGKKYGLSILGDEAPPLRIGMLSPWTEPYLADTYAAVVDRKALPCGVVARDYSPGCRPGGWHVNHLGRNYALASRDNANHDYGVTSVVGHWRREPRPVARVEDLTTLLMSFERNARFPAPGTNPAEFGVVQRGGKLIALKALPQRDRFEDKKTPILALQSTVAILSFGDLSRREVWVNERRADAVSGAKPDPGGDWLKRIAAGMLPAGASAALPEGSAQRGVVTAQDGDVIAVNDGATYVGLIPVVVNPLERDRQVEISYEYPALQIHAFLYRGTQPLDLDRYLNAREKPTAGFVVEMADAADYPSFDAFRRHLREARLTVRWNAEKKLAEVAYASGEDLLEIGFDPGRYPAAYRRVNGAWPYLPEGIMRESFWAVQGSTGRLEKHGAVLESQPGRPAYLQAVPETGTFIGYNPLPDPMPWSLAAPGGITVRANGKLGLARVALRPAENRVWIDYAVKPGQDGAEMATGLLLFGAKEPPAVTINDVPFAGRPATIQAEGRTAYVIPLPAR